MEFIWILAASLLLGYVQCENQTLIELEKLIPKPELNGRSCAATDLVVLKSNELDLVSCAVRCHSIMACRSFFYSNVTKHCEGCSQKYGNTTLLPEMDGTIYMYRNASQTAFNIQSYNRSPKRLTFPEAQTYCEGIGGYVLQVDSADENQFVADIMGDTSFMWLGLTDEQTEGNWVWLQPDKATGYTNLAAGSNPSEANYRLDENCAAVSRGSAYQWRDKDCLTMLYVLCELL